MCCRGSGLVQAGAGLRKSFSPLSTTVDVDMAWSVRACKRACEACVLFSQRSGPIKTMSDLHEAAALGSVDQLQQAMRRGADVNLPDQYLMNKCVHN